MSALIPLHSFSMFPSKPVDALANLCRRCYDCIVALSIASNFTNVSDAWLNKLIYTNLKAHLMLITCLNAFFLEFTLKLCIENIHRQIWRCEQCVQTNIKALLMAKKLVNSCQCVVKPQIYGRCTPYEICKLSLMYVIYVFQGRGVAH